MIRRFLNILAARRSGEAHPDMTFEDVARPPDGKPRTRVAQQMALSEPELHPDFDFEADLFAFPADTVSALHHPPVPQGNARHAGARIADLVHPVVMEPREPGAAEDSPRPRVEPEPEPLDLAISLDELAVEEGYENPDFDWDAARIGCGDDPSWPAGEPTEMFDFDISDLEAEREAEPLVPETPSARDYRLDGVAAELVLGLGAIRSRDRWALHRRFRAILEDFPHHASHLALHRLQVQGASLDELEEAACLRRQWLDQPWLWAQRRRNLQVWEVWRNPALRLAFGWPDALRLIRSFGVVEAERALGEEWFDAWAGLPRHRVSSAEEEAAFFSYAEFLRQVSRPIVLSISEGVEDEPSDRGVPLDLRDGKGLPVWKFERKLPPRAGELSLDPVRVRSHRQFEAAATADCFGLGGLQASSGIEPVATGYRRAYHFPPQENALTAGARVQVSTTDGHGLAMIFALDSGRSSVVVQVAHGLRRLLAPSAAISGRAFASTSKARQTSKKSARPMAKEGNP